MKIQDEEDVPTYTHENESSEMRDEQGKLVKNNENEIKFGYKKQSRHYLGDSVRQTNRNASLTTAAYHKDTKILVIGILIVIINSHY